jgi:4-carboxymuconolactone decarboxylase
MDQAKFEAGLEARRRVLGDEYVDRAFGSADAFNFQFQQIVTEACWGEVWGRDTLTDGQRSLQNLCILAALNRGHEFKVHVRGAVRNGCTLDEIRDTLVQVAVYCGIPAGVEAFRLAREVLTEMGVEVPPRPGDDPATPADVGGPR